MAINKVAIPYPDFQLHEIIDPDQFDLNNAKIVDKINEILNTLNQITDSVASGGSGADKISLTPIAPFLSSKLQTFLSDVVGKLQSSTSGSSGAEFVGTPLITGVTGTTIHAQLVSLKNLFDAVKLTSDTNTSEISALKIRTTNVEGKTTSLEGRAGSLETRATNVENRTATLEGRATSLEGRASANETNISANTNALNTHKTSADHDARYYTKTQLLSKSELNGTSGATNIGTSPIAGLTGATVQAMLSSLKSSIDQATTGGIPDGSITEQKLAFTPATKQELQEETNARNEHQADDTAHGFKEWVKSFGLGDEAKQVSGDVHSIEGTGFYKGYNLAHAPLPNADFYYIVIKHSASYKVVIAVQYDGNIHSKQCVGNVWREWSKILNQSDYDVLFQSVDNGKLNLRTAILGMGGSIVGSHPNSFNELVNGVNSIQTGRKEVSGSISTAPIDPYGGTQTVTINTPFNPMFAMSTNVGGRYLADGNTMGVQNYVSNGYWVYGITKTSSSVTFTIKNDSSLEQGLFLYYTIFG